MSWIASVCLLFMMAGGSKIPDTDIRNTDTPGTNTHFHFEPPKTLAEWTARKAQLREQIVTAAGLSPMPQKAALHPQIFGRLTRKGYTVEKVLLDTFTHYYLGGNLYRPAAAGKHPGVLVAHGHWPYGRLENEPLCNPQALAGTLARLGFVVFMWDMVGYNDTLQTPHKFGGEREQLWSFGPLGLQLWNSIRALDFLSSLNEVDAARIGMTGPSGGATQTMMLTAVDDRISFSAPINMVSAYMQGGDFCENAPGLRVGTNNVEIAALAAPRPMLVVAATGDWTRHVPEEEFPAIQKIYELYDRKALVSMQQFDAPHNMNEQSRNAVERFLAKTILQAPDSGGVDEKGIAVEPLPDMLALFNRTEPTGAENYDELFADWRSGAEKQIRDLGDSDALRQELRRSLGLVWPEKVLHERGAEEAIVLGRAGAGDRITGYYRRKGPKAVLVLHPGGAAVARKTAEARKLAGGGESLLTIDAFQTGAAVAPRNRGVDHFLTYNRSDDSNRAQDVLTSLRFLQQEGCSAIDVFAEGKSAWWGEFAVAAAPADLTISLHLSDQSLVNTEAAFLQNFNVPGVLRVGGLTTADRLLKARPR